MISIDELARTIPVNPPIVNKKTNPIAHINVGVGVRFDSWSVAIQLKIFTPVGIAMIIVAAVK